MDDDRKDIHMMVAIQSRKQHESDDETVSSVFIRDPAVDMIDIVHGSFDFMTTSHRSLRGHWDRGF